MSMPKILRVRAKSRGDKPAGHYGILRRDGDVFNLDEKTTVKGEVYDVLSQFSESWMIDEKSVLKTDEDGKLVKENGKLVFAKSFTKK